MAKRLRVALSQLQEGTRWVEGAEARYLSRVHRVRDGDVVQLFDPEVGVAADAVVGRVEKHQVELVVSRVSPSAASPWNWTLVQAMGKGAKPEQVVRDCTALGVRRLVLATSERSEAKVALDKQGARHARWKRVALDAARQCGRGDLPVIEGPIELPKALSQVTSAIRLALVPHGIPLFAHLASADASQSLAVLIGPEGGLTDRELAEAAELQFRAASLGENILRTELATAATLGALVGWADGLVAPRA